MPKKLLFVSIAFPPKNDPECVQTGRYAYHLNRNFDWDITVVTSKIPTLFMPYDASLERLSKDFKKIEVPILESKLSNKILSILSPKLLSQPDSKFTFYKQWKTVINKYQKPDIIYSRSFPLSSALMALKLKEYYKVPWIMHLSDPWVESPLHNMTSQFHQKNEQICFEQADAISFTTEEALMLYKKKYPTLKKKFFISTNVFEEAKIIPSNGIKLKQKTTIVYTGGLANTRSAKVFLEALNKAVLRDSSLENKLEIIFAGDMDKANRTVFERHRNLKCLQHLGIISHGKSLKLQASADILLVIDSEIKQHEKNVFLPSKIIDYAASKKNILSITEKGSPTHKFINEFGGNVFSFNERDRLTKFLINLTINSKPTQNHLAITERYSAEYQVNILNNKLNSLL